MKKKLVILTCILMLLSSAFVWMNPAKISSDDERRKLTQFPELSFETVSDGSFMEKFESYTKEQFPNRYTARKLKALFRYYGLQISENNDIYIDSKKAIKRDYPLKESEIIKASSKFNSIYHQYLSEDNHIVVSVIPDKAQYSLKKHNPKIDVSEIETILKDNLEFGEMVSIKGKLSLDDYYNTDIHWKQENISDVAIVLLDKLNQEKNINYTTEHFMDNFKGVYAGHSALPLKADTINYISNKSIKEATVTLLNDENEYSVYNNEAIVSKDPYDFFLHGPQAIVEIENPNASSDRELIIFRDSFASSLTPYFIDHYTKITLVDIRYISSDTLGEYIKFADQDILFLMNTAILNSSSMLR